MKWFRSVALVSLTVLVACALIALHYYHKGFTPSHHASITHEPASADELEKIKSKIHLLRIYAAKKGYSTAVCFLADMSMPSGKKRFFVVNMDRGSVLTSGLVSHGSCNKQWLAGRKYDNAKGCGCTSLGRYKIGYPYQGRFGRAYKLFGLDSSNSNAFERAVVLHSYQAVPDEEVDPYPICQSYGCPMVSPRFLKQLQPIIDSSKKPLLLWIFE